MSSEKQQKSSVIGLALGWLAAAAVGFTAYLDPKMMKFFLAMNFLMLAYTLVVLGPWIKRMR